MESGNLKVFSIECWWPLEVRVATKLFLYLRHSDVFTIFVGNYLSNTFNL